MRDYLLASGIAALSAWEYEDSRKHSFAAYVEMSDHHAARALVGRVVVELGNIRSLAEKGIVAKEMPDVEVSPVSILNLLMTDPEMIENGGLIVLALHRDNYDSVVGREMLNKILTYNYQVAQPKRMPVMLVDNRMRSVV